MRIDETLERNDNAQPEDCKVETPMEYVGKLVVD
jgi:hypothetical protein